MNIQREAWCRVADEAELAKLKRGEDPRPYLVALSRAGKLESTLSLGEIVAHLKSGALSGIPVDLSGREFPYRTDLSGADLREVNLEGSHLYTAKLQGAVLQGAVLQRTIFYWANLQGATLIKANLRGANLREVNLQGANLYWAKLHRSDISGADLRGANLEGANFQGADLREAIYDPSKLEGTIGTPIT